MKTARLCLALVVVICAVLALWAFWLEPASLRTSENRVELDGWPDQCGGLRVAVLSDLHVGSPYNGLARLETIVTTTNAARPDLVLLPGDFVIQGVLGGRFVPPEAAAKILAGLQPRGRVYAVLGNHDWWLDAERVRSALEAEGIPVLEDRALEVSLRECRFHLVGISDFWEGPHDLQKALSGLPAGATAVAFTHNPDVFPHLPQSLTLTIAGHTHGGQVYLPGIGRPIVPSDYGSRYAIGHIQEDGRDMFVSTGVGTSILPVRFLVPPEITLLNIYGKPEPGTRP